MVKVPEKRQQQAQLYRMVDAVKHMNVNVMTIWEDEKQEVAPMDEMKNRFFVRIGAGEKEKLKICLKKLHR